MDRKTEKRAADILLKRGVKVTIKAPLFLRWFGKKTIALVVQAPTLYTLIRIAEESLRIDVELEKEIQLNNAISVVNEHGITLSRIVALAVLNNPRKQWRVGLLSRYLLRNIDVKELFYLYQLILLYGGYEDFINTIRFTQTTRITKPMNLSQQEKRS